MKICYAVNNLRSLEKMVPVELRPITILVGANNSGKSTFLQSFSLLKQSIEEYTSEPILWFDSKSVDFGSFHTAVNRTNAANQISFEFEVHDLEFRGYAPDFVNLPSKFGRKNFLSNVHYEICVKCNGDNTYISKIGLDIKDYDLPFTVTFDNEGNFVPELDNTRLSDTYMENMVFRNEKMLSNTLTSSKEVSLLIDDISDNIQTVQNYFDLLPFTNFIICAIRRIILKILNAECEHFTNNSENLLVIEREARKIAFLHPFDEDKARELCRHFKDDNLSNFYTYLLDKKHRSILKQIQQHCAMNLILLVQCKLNSKLQDILKACTRVGAVRDFSQRFFSLQSLNVSSISTDGDNFPMFLYSLKLKNELESFSDWINDIIGYKIGIEMDAGFMRIIVMKKDLNLDLVDTGKGLSKLLPVLAQIWMATVGHDSISDQNTMKKSGKIKLITLEQPELHLHPKHQANLADAFASALESFKSLDIRPIFIVETHSDALINRLGALIENQKVSKDDIQIVLFSKRNSKPNSTEISTSTFDDEGVLIDWPYGFFNY